MSPAPTGGAVFAHHRCLPEAPHAIHVKECFIRDEHKVARPGLCDQHSVEGIACRRGSLRARPPSPTVIANSSKSWPATLLAMSSTRSPTPGSLPRRLFSGHLPSRRRADQYCVRFVCDRVPGGVRQPFPSGEPLQEGVRVEQEPHRSSRLPSGQLGLRERVEETVVDHDPPLPGTELPFARALATDEPRNRLRCWDCRHRTAQIDPIARLRAQAFVAGMI